MFKRFSRDSEVKSLYFLQNANFCFNFKFFYLSGYASGFYNVKSYIEIISQIPSI